MISPDSALPAQCIDFRKCEVEEDFRRVIKKAKNDVLAHGLALGRRLSADKSKDGRHACGIMLHDIADWIEEEIKDRAK